MSINEISVRGARQHNLKNIDVDIPRDKFVVITGLSGSGKSSLAFDTIYAEGQRRYVESLSAYARQFLDQLEKPDVDSVEGLSPAISIEQKTVSRSPRSTVGTVTEIYDFLRLLFSSIGQPHCHQCGRADNTAIRRPDRQRHPRIAGRRTGNDPRPGRSRAQRRISEGLEKLHKTALCRPASTARYASSTKRSRSKNERITRSRSLLTGCSSRGRQRTPDRIS